MRAIEIARRLAALDQETDACQAYMLAIREAAEPAEELEAAAYILQSGGNYKISYTCFRDLYNRGCFREEILPVMTAAFYEPNVKLLKARYEKNCKLLKRYPYLFRKDFLPFEELPIRFYPYDDEGYIPFYPDEERFGDYIDFKNPVISRNFFKDLENPILAEDVYSQYELEYLNDNVRESAYVARENHIYLHYTDWAVFCAYLQCLNLRPVLLDQKIVFLMEEEAAQYPIDFKERFGLDYSQYKVRPVGVREVSRLIWHTQLSTHNGGDFFNEVLDAHPNLLCLPSVMLENVEAVIADAKEKLGKAQNLGQALQICSAWERPDLAEELYRLKDRTDKDIFVATFLCDQRANCCLDPNARIAPAIFFQPHFGNIIYRLRADESGQTVLEAESYKQIRNSPIFRNFKYIKTFTPMRRFTTSHGATVRFMYNLALEENAQRTEKDKTSVVSDAISERILNRSFMIDPEDRLYKDSVLVRFEDGKLNPKATFTALAAFLDLPYTESLTYCSEYGDQKGGQAIIPGNAAGFDPVSVYKTYDDYVNDAERRFIEYFLRDAYQYYGYDFQYYDGSPMDGERAAELIAGFTTLDHYIRETWRIVFRGMEVAVIGERVAQETEEGVQDRLLEDHMENFARNRLANAKIMLEGLRFVNGNGQPLRMMPKLELDPALLEQPLYH